MAGDSHNPYQAPVEEAAEKAESAYSWCVSGDYLLVRPGALLPPVALEGTGKRLTPALYRFNTFAGGYKAVAGLLIPILLVVGWINGTAGLFDDGIRRTGTIVLAAIAMAILSRTAKTINAMVWGFAPVETLRKKSRRRSLSKRLLTSGLLLLGVTFVAVVVSVPHYLGRRGLDIDGVLAWLLPALALCLGLMIASVACGGFKSGVSCTRLRDGWLYLKGVPPESLIKFGAKSMEPPPGKRTRKVYTQYLHQLPASRLTGKKWTPWTSLRFAILASKRSPLMERMHFHISERITLPLSEADPDLLAKWMRETSGTPLSEWSLALANRIDSPQGDLRTEWIFHASPDWRHFAALSVRRFAAGTFFNENEQMYFFSWGEDGRSFFTCPTPPALPEPEHHDSSQAGGNLEEIEKAHRSRLRSIPLAPAADAHELGSRMEADVEASALLAETRGEQSVLKEMEIPEFPK